MQSIIETHQRLVPADFQKRIVVLPAQEEKKGSLEFADYSKAVERGLRNQGFRVVPPGEPAELVALFGYDVGEGPDELYSYALSQFGQTGVSSSQTFGTLNSY